MTGRSACTERGGSTFVFCALWLLDRTHLVRAVFVSVATSVLLYLLLEVA